MSVVAVDPRIKTGAYVREGSSVYEVVGQEKDSDGGITGLYALENIKGVYCSGRTYVHSRISRTASQLAQLELVMAAAEPGVPEYLDAQMDEQIKNAGIEF